MKYFCLSLLLFSSISLFSMEKGPIVVKKQNKVVDVPTVKNGQLLAEQLRLLNQAGLLETNNIKKVSNFDEKVKLLAGTPVTTKDALDFLSCLPFRACIFNGRVLYYPTDSL